MPAKITFTKKEESVLQELFDSGHTDVASLLNKMEKARSASEKFKGVSVQWVLGRVGEVLGDRITLPPNRTVGWYAKMQRSLNDNGIDEKIAEKAIDFVKVNWTGSVWIETLIYSMAKIAAGGMPGNGKNSRKTSGWLNQLDTKED